MVHAERYMYNKSSIWDFRIDPTKFEEHEVMIS
jgi:hypothetical protein